MVTVAVLLFAALLIASIVLSVIELGVCEERIRLESDLLHLYKDLDKRVSKIEDAFMKESGRCNNNGMGTEQETL